MIHTFLVADARVNIAKVIEYGKSIAFFENQRPLCRRRGCRDDVILLFGANGLRLHYHRAISASNWPATRLPKTST